MIYDLKKAVLCHLKLICHLLLINHLRVCRTFKFKSLWQNRKEGFAPVIFSRDGKTDKIDFTNPRFDQYEKTKKKKKNTKNQGQT